jgi:mRNA-degrading endonuclease toxin of MazEF toxin-antitoxin module
MACNVPTHGDSPDEIESKNRPVLIIQRDDVTDKRNTVVVLPLTTNLKRLSPTSSLLKKEEYGLGQDSVILCDQFFSINKDKIGVKICRLTDDRMIALTTKYRYIVNL